MTGDTSPKVMEDAGSNPGATTVRQRKKRKWDQPAEPLITAGLTVPGMLSFVGAGTLAGVGLPGMVPPLAGVLPSVALPSAFMSAPQISSASSVVQQNAAAIVQKINQDLANKGLLSQSKIQDELIAREIVINDADPAVRYKLTKRQTQEEIQATTGAVVITRGRYRPPNGPVENEKPLYLHISAGAHLKDTAERIKAVDQAAAMVDEILRQGRQLQSASAPFSAVPGPGGLGIPPLSAAVLVGLEADPALNLVCRIRGPNDQYINHIMNETGATVVLRGKGSRNYEGPLGEELQQPLHLFISSDNLKSLENAKHLAENLLETIRLECFASRPPTYNVASAGSIAAPVTCSVPLQSSISPYQVSSYAASTVGVGPYAGVYPSSVVSYPQNHAPNLVSFPSANTYSLSSSLPQPGALDTATLTATDPYMNKLSTLRVYNAVPPPQQLLTENKEVKADTDKANETSAVSTTSVGDSTAGTLFSSTAAIGLPVITSSCVAPQPNLVCTGLYGTPGAVASTIHSHPSSPGLAFSFGQITSTSYPQVQQTQPAQSPHVAAVAPGTSYSGYGGIYPQATPLQQVALALQRPPPPMSIKPDSAHTASTPTKAQSTFNNGQSEKQPTQRRKFQELPVAAKEPPKDDQV
eukprot:Gb_05577 [translate_table: standard]